MFPFQPESYIRLVLIIKPQLFYRTFDIEEDERGGVGWGWKFSSHTVFGACTLRYITPLKYPIYSYPRVSCQATPRSLRSQSDVICATENRISLRRLFQSYCTVLQYTEQ